MFQITAKEKEFILNRRKVIAFKQPKEMIDLANELSKLKAKEFTKRFGKSIGKGSSREVYKHKNYVIKRALNEFGKEQNQRQDEIYRLGWVNRKLLAPVYAKSKDNKVIIMGYAKPIKKFSNAIKKKLGIEKVKIDDPRYKNTHEMELLVGQKWEQLMNWEWGPSDAAKILLDLNENKGAYGFGGDFTRPSSYGLIGNRIVLIDYGY